MRVCRRLTGGLALICVLFSPAIAAADPILHEYVATSDGSTQLFEGTFEWDNDVVLVTFILGEGEYDLTAFTSSYAGGNFDPLMSLYYAALPTDPLLQYTYVGADGGVYPAISDDIDFDNLLYDAGLTLTLTQAGIYTLALTQTGNSHHESLSFDWDDDAFRCGGDIPETCEAPLFGGASSAFALNIQLTPVDTQPVPEPGTLSLIGIGISALVLGRRRRVGTRSIHR